MWQTVYSYFTKWGEAGTLVALYDALRAKDRQRAGRDAEPTAVIIDSQSVKATEQGGMWAMMRERRLRE